MQTIITNAGYESMTRNIESTFEINFKDLEVVLPLDFAFKNWATIEYCVKLPKGSKLPRVKSTIITLVRYYKQHLAKYMEDKISKQIMEEEDNYMIKELLKKNE